MHAPGVLGKYALLARIALLQLAPGLHYHMLPHRSARPLVQGSCSRPTALLWRSPQRALCSTARHLCPRDSADLPSHAALTRAAPVATTAKSDGAEAEQHARDNAPPAQFSVQWTVSFRKPNRDLKSWQVLRIDHFGKHSDEAYLQAETSRIARAKNR
jgi:hypothetical protein